jgi:hypothetical protein
MGSESPIEVLAGGSPELCIRHRLFGQSLQQR